MVFNCHMNDHNKNHGPKWGWSRPNSAGGPPWARFAPFGSSSGPSGPRIRMFAQGDLRLLLLALISDQPSHGYDLIRTIEARFGGNYAPSPGTIYPSLTFLEEQGFIAARPELGGKKSYEATTAGRKYLDEQAAHVAALMARIDVMARGSGHAPMPESVMHAIQTLRHAIMSRFGKWEDAEENRVRTILEQAAREIASGSTSEFDK